MKAVTKIFLITIVILIALTNYKFLNGMKLASNKIESITKYNENKDFIEDLLYFENAYYYKNPFKDNYILIITTKEKDYYTYLSEKEIEVLKLTNNILPINALEKIEPIPIYVYIGAIILVLIIPLDKKNK